MVFIDIFTLFKTRQSLNEEERTEELRNRTVPNRRKKMENGAKKEYMILNSELL